MEVSWYFTAIITGALVSLVSSAVLLLLGGYGGYRVTIKGITALNDEVERLDEKITSEVKKRAALSKKPIEDPQIPLELVQPQAPTRHAILQHYKNARGG